MYTALRATSLTLARFLEQEFRNDTLLRTPFDPAAGGTMVVSLNSPPEMADNHSEGLSVWLYRVERDEQRLNAPPVRVAPNRLRQAPLPVRLHYLITPLVGAATAASPETEQLILGKVLQVLYDHPTLRGIDLADDYVGTEVELNVRLEPHTLEESAKVREMLRLERTYELAVSYEVGVVYIESMREPGAVSPVWVALPEYGLITAEESRAP